VGERKEREKIFSAENENKKKRCRTEHERERRERERDRQTEGEERVREIERLIEKKTSSSFFLSAFIDSENTEMLFVWDVWFCRKTGSLSETARLFFFRKSPKRTVPNNKSGSFRSHVFLYPGGAEK